MRSSVVGRDGDDPAPRRGGGRGAGRRAARRARRRTWPATGRAGAGSTSVVVSPRGRAFGGQRPARGPTADDEHLDHGRQYPPAPAGSAKIAVGLGASDSLRGVDDEARAARRSWVAESGVGLATSPFRVDRDRIAASPFFARLAGVTQVVSPAGAGLLVHNRLTHSLQVAQVARAIAERLADRPAVGRAGRLRPRRRRGRRAGPRPRPPAVRAPRRAGARPGGPRAPRPPRRLRGQRAELPHRHHHRPARAERHRARPHRRRARGRPQVPVDPARPPRPAPVRRAAAAARGRPAARRARRGLGQVLRLQHRAGRPRRLPRRRSRSDPVAADGGGRGDGHRRRHRLRHPRPRGLPPGRGAAAGRCGRRS